MFSQFLNVNVLPRTEIEGLKSSGSVSKICYKKCLPPESTSLLEPTHGRARSKRSLSPQLPGSCEQVLPSHRHREMKPEVPGGSQAPGYRAMCPPAQDHVGHLSWRGRKDAPWSPGRSPPCRCLDFRSLPPECQERFGRAVPGHEVTLSLYWCLVE